MMLGQVVPDMGMKRQIDVVDSPTAALDLQETPAVVVVMKAQYAIQAVQAALDFDRVTRAGAVGMLPADLFAFVVVKVAKYIDMACDLVA